MMKTINLNAWGSNHPISFHLANYADNDNLYVGMITWDDPKFPEPWSDLTVNLGVKCAEDCAFIDTNNNGEKILLWLIENNLGDLTGKMQPSGFCLFPEFKFNIEELKKYSDGV